MTISGELGGSHSHYRGAERHFPNKNQPKINLAGALLQRGQYQPYLTMDWPETKSSMLFKIGWA